MEAPDRPKKWEAPPTIPIIKIQRASRSSDHSEAAPEHGFQPQTIDSILVKEHPTSFEQGIKKGSDLVATLPVAPNNLPEVPCLPEAPIVPIKIRKRHTALRKTRNALARKTFLKIGLGSQLAVPTKEALRLLAKGQDINVAGISLLS